MSELILRWEGVVDLEDGMGWLLSTTFLRMLLIRSGLLSFQRRRTYVK